MESNNLVRYGHVTGLLMAMALMSVFPFWVTGVWALIAIFFWLRGEFVHAPLEEDVVEVPQPLRCTCRSGPNGNWIVGRSCPYHGVG